MSSNSRQQYLSQQYPPPLLTIMGIFMAMMRWSFSFHVIYIYIYIYIEREREIAIDIDIDIYVYICMYMCICTHMCVYTYVCVHIYIYIYILFDPSTTLPETTRTARGWQTFARNMFNYDIFMDVQTYPKRFLPEPFEAYWVLTESYWVLLSLIEFGLESLRVGLYIHD